MNILFPALSIFAILMPGILFQRAYNQGMWNYPLGRLGPIGEQTTKAFAAALGINMVWAAIIEGAAAVAPRFIPSIDFVAATAWLTNNLGPDPAASRSVRAFTQYKFHVLLYFCFLYAFAHGLGVFLHWLVRRLKLDLKHRRFRFDNDWHYIFKAEILRFQDSDYRNSANASIEDERVGTLIAAVVDFKDQSVLFLGILVDYFFDASGNLERILLEGVRRRDLKRDSLGEDDQAARWYEIRGNYFVLRVSECKTLNIDYLMRSDIEEAERLADTAEAEAEIRDGGLGG